MSADRPNDSGLPESLSFERGFQAAFLFVEMQHQRTDSQRLFHMLGDMWSLDAAEQRDWLDSVARARGLDPDDPTTKTPMQLPDAYSAMRCYIQQYAQRERHPDVPAMFKATEALGAREPTEVQSYREWLTCVARIPGDGPQVDGLFTSV